MKNSAKTFVTCLLLGVVVSGCARTPSVEIGYYLPKTDLAIKVTRTVVCDSEGNPIIASTFDTTPSHSADRSAFQRVALGELDGFLSTTKLTFDFYDDGRLKGINTNSTGRAREFFKGVARLAASLRVQSAPVMALEPEKQQEDTTESSAPTYSSHMSPEAKLCKHVDIVGRGKPKALTLQFVGVAELAKCNDATVQVEATLESAAHVEHLMGEDAGLGSIMMTITPVAQKGTGQADIGSDRSPDVALKMRYPGTVKVDVEIEGGAFEGLQESWSGTELIAQCGTEYQIPIPKAALFGEQTFTLAVADTGVVTKLSYTKESGAADVVGVGEDLLDLLGAEAAATAEAAALNAEAARIAALERLVRCRADSANCQ